MMLNRFVTGLISALMTGLGVSTIAAAVASDSLSSELKAANRTVLGEITMTAAPNGMLLHIEAKGLPAGWHGVHLHEKGDCTDAKFANAGSHVHHGEKLVHGLLNPAANDAGDLPNVFVSSGGSLTVELYTTMASLVGGKHRVKLADGDGFAVVIHTAPDDYKTQPIGGAGARIACAAFK